MHSELDNIFVGVIFVFDVEVLEDLLFALYTAFTQLKLEYTLRQLAEKLDKKDF